MIMAEKQLSTKKALELINEAVTILTANPSSSKTLISSSTTTDANANTAVTQPTFTTSSSSEISKLFPSMFRAKSSFKPNSKRWHPYKPKDSWTHTFVVLSSRDQNWVPSREERTKLSSAGLGEKRIVFSDKRGSWEHVKTVLEKEFPKLTALSGGFELLRSNGSRRTLELIPIPPLGYCVQILKEALGQAVCYVRPLQIDLDLSYTSKPDIIDLTKAPTVPCLNCQENVPLSLWRSHEEACKGGPSNNDTKGGTSNNDTKKEEDQVSKLLEMFPGESKSTVENVLLGFSGDINKAAAKLAGCHDLDEDIDLPPCDITMKDSCKAIDIYRAKREKGTEYIEINRMQLSLLRQLMRIYKNPKLNMKYQPDVLFSGEHGADMGGPTKEYFHSAIASLSKVDPAFNIQLFGGNSGHMVPLYGVDAISSGCFEMAGKLLAHSILHEGPGLVGLAPAIVKYLTTGSLSDARKHVTIEDLYDLELKQILEEEVLSKPTVNKVSQSAKDKVEDLLVKHGLTDVPLTDVNKEKAIEDLLVAEVLVTRTLALDTFFKGLNTLGLGDLLRRYPSIVNDIFPSQEEISVDVEIVKAKLNEAKQRCLSTSDEVELAWKWFLEFVDEAITLKVADTTMLTLLVLFFTGSSVVDTNGRWEVAFQKSSTKTLLEADSCFNRVTIPICHKTYSEFKEGCCISLENGSIGYGRF